MKNVKKKLSKVPVKFPRNFRRVLKNGFALKKKLMF